MPEAKDRKVRQRDEDAQGPFRKARIHNGKGKTRTKAAAKNGPVKTDASARLEQLNRAVLIGTFTTVAALIFGIASIVSSQATVSRVTSNMTDIVIATREVPAGTTLTNEMVELTSVPASYVATSSLGSTSDAIGKTASLTITPNSQITSGMLADAQSATSLAAKIPKGHKAITIKVAADTGLHNLLRCGDLVDVYVTDSETYETQVIAASVPVLALDAALTGPDSTATYSTVSLDVTEEEAASILTSQEQGTVSLALNPLSN